MKNKAIVCALCGFLFGFFSYFIFRVFEKQPLLWAILCGTLFYLLLMPALYLEERIRNKRYAQAEQAIVSPIWYRMNGNVKTLQGVRNANVYFTDGGIVFISLDKKPYCLEEVLKHQIERYDTNDTTILNIYTNDNRMFLITSAEVRTLIAKLKDHRWIA